MAANGLFDFHHQSPPGRTRRAAFPHTAGLTVASPALIHRNQCFTLFFLAFHILPAYERSALGFRLVANLFEASIVRSVGQYHGSLDSSYISPGYYMGVSLGDTRIMKPNSPSIINCGRFVSSAKDAQPPRYLSCPQEGQIVV